VRAARLVAPGRFEVVEAPRPVARPGQVVVEMERASICGSDLHAVHGDHPRPIASMPPGGPGHEGIGTVVETADDRYLVGDRVLTVPLPGEGACYAELQAVGADFLVPVPEGDPGQLVLAQQLGTTIFGFARYWPKGRDASGATAAILGAGSAGLFLLQLAKRAGFAQVVVSDLDQSRLEVAKALGADVVAQAPFDPFVPAVLRATGGAGAELVVDATGKDAGRAQCVEAARQGGRIGLFGLPEHPGPVPFPVATAFRRAATLEMAGSAQLEPGLASFAEAVRLVSSGAIRTEHMLEPTFPLSRFPEAFQAARGRAGVKVSIDPTC